MGKFKYSNFIAGSSLGHIHFFKSSTLYPTNVLQTLPSLKCAFTLTFLSFRMGSFTSMPKIRPAPNSDDTDVDYGNVGERVGLDDFLAKCKNQLGSLPPLIPRNVRHRKNSLGNEGK